jgi:hypothetical protein
MASAEEDLARVAILRLLDFAAVYSCLYFSI